MSRELKIHILRLYTKIFIIFIWKCWLFVFQQKCGRPNGLCNAKRILQPWQWMPNLVHVWSLSLEVCLRLVYINSLHSFHILSNDGHSFLFASMNCNETPWQQEKANHSLRNICNFKRRLISLLWRVQILLFRHTS